jgi:hypothetical protein
MKKECGCFIGTIGVVPGTWGREALTVRKCTYPKGPCLFKLIKYGIVDLGDRARGERAVEEALVELATEVGMDYEPDLPEAPLGAFYGQCQEIEDTFLPEAA